MFPLRFSTVTTARQDVLESGVPQEEKEKKMGGGDSTAVGHHPLVTPLLLSTQECVPNRQGAFDFVVFNPYPLARQMNILLAIFVVVTRCKVATRTFLFEICPLRQ
jgi:hypothetical protein